MSAQPIDRAPVYDDRPDRLLSQTVIDNPTPFYEALLARGPLSRIGETGVHIVATRPLIEQVLGRPDDFSANLRRVLLRGDDGELTQFDIPISDATRVIATADDPAHAVHRKILQPHFTPRRIALLEQQVLSWVVEEMSPLIERGGGDVIAACERVPARVVAALLGLPQEDVDHFRRWAMMGGDMLAGEVTLDTMMFLAGETGRMSDYLGAHLDAATAQADDDAATNVPMMQVLAAAVQSGTINRQQALGIAVVLFGAGGESTAALMASCLRVLAERDDLAARLRNDPALIAPFVEEVVRLETPFKFHYRAVQRDCALGGYSLRQGDTLMLMWAAANRDPGAIPDADQLLLDRKHPRQHLGFGHGVHFCIGAALARLEARAMLAYLLTRCRSVTLAPDRPAYANSIFVRRLERLELQFSARV